MRFVISSVFVLLLVALAFGREEDQYQQNSRAGCSLMCPLIYAPVCGRDDCGRYRTFNNQCLFDAHNCKNPDSKYEHVSYTACEQDSPQECPNVCPAVYRPVCGRNNGGDLRTFSNQCEMNSYNCKHPHSPYKYVQYGDCDNHENADCPKFCTKELRPVCAKGKDGDLRTFSNECEVSSYNCDNPESEYETISNGGCADRDTERCPKACPHMYRPICARNSYGHHRTFSNECVLAIYNCNNPDLEYVRVYDGKC